MAAHKVEQLLHGYHRGHEQLAASVKLPDRDAELVTRLSDLSGSLSGAPPFASYLTVYPLPSGRYFALGKTWPDPDAARAGCVLTHTLLVPVPTWVTLAEPRVLDGLFTLSPSRSTLEYSSSIAIPVRSAPEAPALRNNDQNVLLTFVHRYFGEGKRPVVWFGQVRPEEVLWLLLRGLWPKLRATFSACTFCLQPRTLEDRAFELMFAPSAAYPRFLKIKPGHFIDATAGLRTDQQDDKVEPWSHAWAKRLFGPLVPGLPPGEPDLWTELDEDPTAVRRLFVIEGLMKDTSAAPQVFVGAMDLVESLAKDRDAAVVSKQRVAVRAVRTAREAGDPASGLECLRLIDDRLRRTSFSRVQDAVGPALLDAVSAHTRKFPEITVQSALRPPAGVNLKESWFGRGLLQGFRTLARDEPDKLLVLRNAPGVAGHILTAEPEVGAAFIRAAAARRGDRDTRADLLRWLVGVQDHESRSNLRASLVPMLGSDDVDILAELLKDLRAEEVGVMLDALWHQTRQFEPSGIRDLVIGQIARGHPSETRVWTRRLSQWTPIVAHVFAATYPPTRQGLLELLDGDKGSLGGGQRAEAVAAFMQGLGPGRYPYWLTDLAREQPSLLSTLLDAAASSSPTVIEQTQKLLSEAPNLPVAHSPSLLRQVLDSSQQPYFGTLLDVTMRSLVPGCVAGLVSEAVSRPFQEDRAVVSWFHTVEPRDLKSLVTRDTWSSTVHWFNAWRWTAIAPEAVYAREPTLLPELINALSQSHHSEWSQQISDMWSQILRRSRSESHSLRTRLVLCVQALKFSFDNNRLPLGPVVVEAFHDVYAAVTESSTSPLEAAPLFSIFDWDKGKELRRELVDSFLHSQWPPGDLVLAVADVRLLRKIFKRLMKKHDGERYAQAALADLELRTDQNATKLARALRDMLAKPDFYEEWD